MFETISINPKMKKALFGQNANIVIRANII